MNTGSFSRVDRIFRFPREEKLKGRDEIRKLFNARKCVSCPGVKLFTLRNGLQYNRIAFTFSRKFGNAVKRNRSRRLGREAYRLLRDGLVQGNDMAMLLFPERDPAKDTLLIRMNQFRELFSRAGLIKS